MWRDEHSNSETQNVLFVTAEDVDVNAKYVCSVMCVSKQPTYTSTFKTMPLDVHLQGATCLVTVHKQAVTMVTTIV